MQDSRTYGNRYMSKLVEKMQKKFVLYLRGKKRKLILLILVRAGRWVNNCHPPHLISSKVNQNREIPTCPYWRR